VRATEIVTRDAIDFGTPGAASPTGGLARHEDIRPQRA